MRQVLLSIVCLFPLATLASSALICDQKAVDAGDLAAVWDCERLEYQKTDAQLNKAYRNIIAKLDREKKTTESLKLKENEKKWRKTKIECDGRITGGHQEAMLALSNCIELTKGKIDELRKRFPEGK